MKNHLIDFETLEWEEPAVGVRYKKYITGNKQIRLLEFSEGFIEKEYCTKGHIAIILEGSLKLDFNGHLEVYDTGKTVIIPAGESDKHKAILGAGELVRLLLIEEIANFITEKI